MKKRILIGIFMLLSAWCALLGQSNTVVCGGSQKNADQGEVVYSVGQVDYLYSKSSAGASVAGVNQPYEENYAYHLMCDGIELTLFPNPVRDNFYVRADIVNVAFPYVLTNFQGQLISEGKLTGEYTSFSLTGAPAGNYFLKIKYGNGSEDFSVFKIVKL